MIRVTGTQRRDKDSPVTGAPVTGWPDASNTGVPAGTVLTDYTGPSGYNGAQTLTIQNKTINSELRLYDDVKITLINCKINGHIDCDAVGTSVVMVDCTLDAGAYSNAATGFRNLTFTRCNISGGITSVNAAVNVYVEDCYLWGQYVAPTGDSHTGGFLCSGGSDITMKHCTIWNSSHDNGDGGGPSASVNLYANFARLERITFDSCLVRATDGGYAATFGDNPGTSYPPPTGIVVRDCVFEKGANGKGGAFGTVTSWYAPDPSNQWINNTWDDGTPIPSNI